MIFANLQYFLNCMNLNFHHHMLKVQTEVGYLYNDDNKKNIAIAKKIVQLPKKIYQDVGKNPSVK